MNDKILKFEYVIHQLIKWYMDVFPISKTMAYSHFTRLVSLKLLFLVSAIKDPYNKEDNDLLDLFNNYCAMQYGPVEIDVYSDIVNKKTRRFTFGNYSLEDKDLTYSFEELDENTKQRIDRAIELVKLRNPQLITFRASQLVNVTHKWNAWKNAMGLAEWFGKGSEKMSVESIRNSVPFYE